MKSETLRVRNVVDGTRLGAWLRPGESIGWLAAGTMPNSLSNARRLSFSGMCILLFLFLSLCRFGLFVLFFCSHWSLVPRSTGYIMVTTRYSDKHGSKSRQKIMCLYKQWHRPISKRFIKPPCSISKAVSIDSDCCRLPTTSVLSNKANK